MKIDFVCQFHTRWKHACPNCPKLPPLSSRAQQPIHCSNRVCQHITDGEQEPAVHLTPSQSPSLRQGEGHTRTLAHARSLISIIDFAEALLGTYMALLAVVADKAVVETTPHLAHFKVSPVWGSLICLQDNQITRQHRGNIFTWWSDYTKTVSFGSV